MLAEIPRIDVFTIKLIRNHIKSAMHNNSNSLIKGPFLPSDNYHRNAILKGFVPPEAFLYLDKNKYIVNDEMIPIFYLVSRNIRNKKFYSTRRKPILITWSMTIISQRLTKKAQLDLDIIINDLRQMYICKYCSLGLSKRKQKKKTVEPSKVSF